jgi:small subunit ribosomal protein S6
LALNVYENMVILDSNKYAQDPNGLAATVQNLVTRLGGEVLVSRLWNEQKLAYPIKGHRKGTYWLTYMRLDPSKLTEFNRELRINESVVRTLTLLVEPRLVDALVEHAKTGGRAKPADAAPAVDAAEVEEPVGAGVE